MKSHIKRFIAAMLSFVMIMATVPTVLGQEAERENKDQILSIDTENIRTNVVAPEEKIQLIANDISGRKHQAKWSVDHPDIASIDEETGLVTGIKEGFFRVNAVSEENPELTASRTFLVAGGVCRINTGNSEYQYYDTIEAAFKKAADNAVIEVLRDTDFSEPISIHKNITFKGSHFSENEEQITFLVYRTKPEAGLTVAGTGSLTTEWVILDGNQDKIAFENAVTMLTIENGGAVTLGFNGAISSAHSEEGPGGVMNAGSLTLNRGGVGGCSGNGNGGGIYNSPTGKIEINSGSVAFNSAVNGGAIYNDQGSIVIRNGNDGGLVDIGRNTVSEKGGGIYNQEGNIVLESGYIQGNVSAGNGSGIYQNGRLILGEYQTQDNKIQIWGNSENNIYLPKEKMVELDALGISPESNVLITSEEMASDKKIDVVKQLQGKAIVNANRFLSDDAEYSIEPKPEDASVLQMTRNGRIYIGPKGNDANDGSSIEKAVKSLDRAIEIGKIKHRFYLCVLPENEAGETAILSDQVVFDDVLTEIISCNEKGEKIEAPDKGNTITRVGKKAGITLLGDTVALEISNVILDGANIEAEVPMISLETYNYLSPLILNQGTTIQNAKSTKDCGGIYIGEKCKILIDGASVINCHATGEDGVGGIKNDNHVKAFELKSGTITGCSGTLAGGLYSISDINLYGNNVIKIIGNTKNNGSPSNLYLPRDVIANLLTDKLYDGSAVGISSEINPIKEEMVGVVYGPIDHNDNPIAISLEGFSADSPDNKVSYLDEDHFKLALELRQDFTITAEASENGSITPSGSVAVKEGQNQNFVITANTGYEIANVVVDGKSMGPLESYQFENIASDHRIAASFQAKSNEKYTITVDSGGNGSAFASLNQAEKGMVVSLKTTPDKGYQFKEWQVLAGSVKIENNQFTMPAEKVVLKAIFEKSSAPTPVGGGGSVKTGIEGTKTGTAAALLLLSLTGLVILGQVVKRRR